MTTNGTSPPYKRLAIIASIAAVVAVVVAVGAVVIALTALSRSGPSTTQVAPAPEKAADGTDTGPNTPDSGPTKKPSPVLPVPDFTLAYEKKQLKIPAAGPCLSDVGIDVDGPKVNAGSVDFIRTRCASPDAFKFNNVAVSLDVTATATPSECLDKIETSPLRIEAEVPTSALRSGDAFCVLTSRKKAVELGFPQRVALLEFRGADDDGTFTMLATAWNVPD